MGKLQNSGHLRVKEDSDWLEMEIREHSVMWVVGWIVLPQKIDRNINRGTCKCDFNWK
jgi:hypothetical protein